MSKPDSSIDPRILESAKKEFLSCGYEKASTNVICKNAGVTSGALYKRFAGKDELFSALVAPVADEFKAKLNTRHDHFHALSKEEQEAAAIAPVSQAAVFIDGVYEHFDCFKLLIECSKGSSYEHYLDEVVDILVEATMRFMRETGHEAIIHEKKATSEIIHILISSYVYGLFEPVLHNMSREDAIMYAEQLGYFFDVGWADVLRIKNE
ncbi:MAG: TetR/AcrR family transcriptional regulator [Lachnospiraceae bacterium]